ncbi:hypothetical protein Tco_0727966 [Tanacetum coccineum]|uniref:Uncharacterized protein n=1 Tax=Tanacetum coccineum TaxID=301880 RepID=A0ABQ4YM57_9ASTR
MYIQIQISNSIIECSFIMLSMEEGSKDRPPMLAQGKLRSVANPNQEIHYNPPNPNSELIQLLSPKSISFTFQWAEKTVPVAEGSFEEQVQEEFGSTLYVHGLSCKRLTPDPVDNLEIFNDGGNA